MEYKTILYEKSDNIGYVTLNRPKSLNAVNIQMEDELIDVFNSIENDSEVKVAVMTGAGDRAFSAGADIKETGRLLRNVNITPRENVRRRMIGGIAKPTIAAIHGFCLGAGLIYALRCDIRIASQEAQFGFPEIALGVYPFDGATQKLPHLVGMGKAIEMIITGERIDAQEAYVFNLVNKVVPRKELMPTVQKMAKLIASFDQKVVKLCKEGIYRGYDMSAETALLLELDLARLSRAK